MADIRTVSRGQQLAVNPRAEAGKSVAHPAEGMGGLAKGLAVIEAFELTGRLTVSEAARAASITRAAARRCLLTLVQLGYVEHDGKFFRPLPRMLRLGAVYLSGTPLAQRAQSVLSAARDRLNESVSLAVLENDTSAFIARAEAVRIVSTGVRVGARLPAYCSATGRVLLASLSDDDVRARIAATQLVRRTAKTLVDESEVLGAVQAARANGYAISDEELELGMRAMAVAVRDGGGTTIAAMSVSVSSARVTAERMIEEFLPALREHALLLERTNG
jgi:IclR family pca regulon transcriptional regulator